MQEYILPGFSLKNAVWATELQKGLSSVGQFEVVEWPHWSSPDIKFDVKVEAKKLSERLANTQNIVIVAKSVGTLVSMLALPSFKDRVKKLVLCGVPLTELISEGGKDAYQVLSDFPAERLLVIQNSQDNHGACEDVSEFLKKINPRIEVVQKERADHEYPYVQEIREFLQR